MLLLSTVVLELSGGLVILRDYSEKRYHLLPMLMLKPQRCNLRYTILESISYMFIGIIYTNGTEYIHNQKNSWYLYSASVGNLVTIHQPLR